eukprot:CAMPEP_0119022346 /NCGR_PEP_ID=MMETSP1176-20130426/27807_1 /TAXON_ID=265551 /ORGANISM="Synedropsis recta cf, Strain CCMP1620" /LENGTH=68 /DNA_ID=CAMNT_0006977173 /DNA_START=23 /DNA_END=226 /DNA_ORIENTATION=+
MNFQQVIHWLGYLLYILPAYSLKAFGSFLLLKFIHKFAAWYFSPLNAIPGPNSKSFLLGVFPSIRMDP